MPASRPVKGEKNVCAENFLKNFSENGEKQKIKGLENQ